MTDSWWLKLARAKEHLDEIQQLIQPLLERRVSPVSKGWETYQQQPAFHYRVSFANPEPDERLPVIAGDFMHNVRSALDHIAVAFAPRDRQRKAAFPIFTRDVHARDRAGRHLHEADRVQWLRRVQGMPQEAVAVIDAAQPFHRQGRTEDPRDAALALLCEFQDADKHRALTIVTQGLADPVLLVTRGDRPVERLRPQAPLGGLIRDGAVVHMDLANPPTKVEIEVEGTPVVVIGSSPDGPFRKCPAALEKMLTVACVVVDDLAALL